MSKAFTLISTLLLATVSNLAAAPIVVQPVAVGGYSQPGGEDVYYSEFRTSAPSISGGFSTHGLVEFSIGGLPPMTSAVMSAVPDLYCWGADNPDNYNQGVYGLDVYFYEGDGIINKEDQADPARRLTGPLAFAFYSVTFPSYLDITQQYNEAVNRGCSFLGVGFSTHYVTYEDGGSMARAFGPGGPAGDGIVENNFGLTLTPEPATLLLLALGGLAVIRRPGRVAL